MQGLQRKSLFDVVKPTPRFFDKRITTAEALYDAKTDLRGDMMFYPSIFCAMSLPMKFQPGTEFRRKRGEYTLSVLTPAEYGLPCGAYPRGIIAYICSQAIKRKKLQQDNPRIIELGKNVSEFMQRVTGTRLRTGGVRGNGTLFDRQFASLVNSTINYSMPSSEGADGRRGGRFGFADHWEMGRTWKVQNRGEDAEHHRTLTLELDDLFYADLIKHGVPFDDAILKALWPSPLLIDIYTWITFRANAICLRPGQRLNLKWSDVAAQFGSEYQASSLGSFRQKFRRAFAVVRSVYDPFDPDCIRMEEAGDNLIFRAKRPSVIQKDGIAIDRRTISVNPNIPRLYASTKPKPPKQDQEPLDFVNPYTTDINKDWLAKFEYHVGRKLLASELVTVRDLYLKEWPLLAAIEEFEKISAQT